MSGDDEPVNVHRLRHPSAQDRLGTVAPQLLADVDTVLRDHGREVAPSDLQAALAWLLDEEDRTTP